MMRPGLGGLPEQRPDQRYLPPAVGIQPGSAAGVVHARQVIIAATNAGIFVYSPTAAAGNLIGSWTSAAGTDSYGNSYPQGLNVTVGAISGSTISGATISGSLFQGTTFNLNGSGFFLYSGTPGFGNLILSAASSAGTDTYGNTYRAGFVSYSGTALTQLLTGTLQAGLSTDTALVLLSGGQGQSALTSGSYVGDAQATVAAYSASAPANPLPGNAMVDLRGAGGIRCQTINLISKLATPSGYPYSSDPSGGSTWAVGERAYINQLVTGLNSLIAILQNNGLMF